MVRRREDGRDRPLRPKGRRTSLRSGLSSAQRPRSWPTIEVDPPPVPELEGEDVGRRADLEDQVVPAGAVDGAGGDREVVVLPRRPRRNERVGGEPLAIRTGRAQRRGHLRTVDGRLQTEAGCSAM